MIDYCGEIKDFRDVCIVVNEFDNVAVFFKGLELGAEIILPDGDIVVLQRGVKSGERIAIADIPDGCNIVQYGSAFATSKGLGKGDILTRDLIDDIDVDINDSIDPEPPETPYSTGIYNDIVFQGVRRSDGRVGTRNYYIVIPTSLCASETAMQIANEANQKYNISSYSNIDGLIAIHTTEGCGCAANVQIDRFLNILRQYMHHPNVGGTLVIDLGCEQTNYGAVNSYLKSLNGINRLEPIDWMTIQDQGGVKNTIDNAVKIIGLKLKKINSIERKSYPISELVIGTECGGSDAFSGITANPLIGEVVDKVVSAGGSAILTEIPEMFGAEYILMKRMRDDVVINKFRKIINWYKGVAKILNVNMEHNLVPENIAGGLINACIKSLGAVTKGGKSAVEDVLEYGEPLCNSGLNIMQGPGNDMESVTGMVASGANIICFSTGKGTVTGAALVPVVKIASNSRMYERMSSDMDFNAGELLDVESNVGNNELSEKLFNKVVSVASGEKTKSEVNGQRQFQVWTAGKLSL